MFLSSFLDHWQFCYRYLFLFLLKSDQNNKVICSNTDPLHSLLCEAVFGGQTVKHQGTRVVNVCCEEGPLWLKELERRLSSWANPLPFVMQNGNITELLLKEGFARCVDWSMGVVTQGAEKYRAAEKWVLFDGLVALFCGLFVVLLCAVVVVFFGGGIF